MKSKEGAIDAAFLVLRLALGAVFIAHGAQKYAKGIQGFADTLAQLNVPQPLFMAYLAATWELCGGVLVLIGLVSRIAALGLAGIMVVAGLKAHIQNGFFLNFRHTPGQGDGFEYTMVLCAMALAIFIAGAGRISLDHLITSRRKAPQ